MFLKGVLRAVPLVNLMDNDQQRCILHPNERVAYLAQGTIPICADCYFDYREEFRQSEGNLRRRPFLQQLIRASIDNHDNRNRGNDPTIRRDA